MSALTLSSAANRRRSTVTRGAPRTWYPVPVVAGSPPSVGVIVVKMSHPISVYMPTPSSTMTDPLPYSEALFRELAATNPSRLVALVDEGQLPVHFLTFAAEALADADDDGAVVPALRRVLDHASPFVREGAVLGLAGHLSPEVAQVLRDRQAVDSSPGVRDAIDDVLDLA